MQVMLSRLSILLKTIELKTKLYFLIVFIKAKTSLVVFSIVA